MNVQFNIQSGKTIDRTNETKYEVDVTPPADRAVQFDEIRYEDKTLRGMLYRGNDKVKSFIEIYVKNLGSLPPGKYQFNTTDSTFSRVTETAPAQGSAPTEAPTGQSASNENIGPGPSDPLSDPIFTEISKTMDSLVKILDDNSDKVLGKFSSTAGDYYVEITDHVKRFKADPTTAYVKKDTIESRISFFDVTDKIILNTINGYASNEQKGTSTGTYTWSMLTTKSVTLPIDGLPQEIKKLAEKDPVIKKFLIDGLAGSLVGDTRPKMFIKLQGFIQFLGETADTEFIKAIRFLEEESTKKKKTGDKTSTSGTDTKDSEAGGRLPALTNDSTTTANPPPAETGAEAVGGPTKPRVSPGKNDQRETAVDMGEAPKKEAHSDTVLFRYTLFGADPDSTAQMRLIFNDGSALDYEIPAERIGSVNTFIVNGKNRDKIKANIDTYVDVKITAKPMGGGEAVIDTQSVYITKQLADNQIFSYRFMPSLGWRKNTGVDSRGKTVGELISNQGNVRMVFYTRSGSVSVAMCDVSTSVSGKMFKFNFTGDQPLLVPIQLDVTPGLLSESFIKKARRLLNEAVPHWIFLKPGAGGAGGSGDGGKAGGAKQPMNVNIAVSQIMIATDEKWIYIPNVGNPFNRESFKFAVAGGSIKRYGAIPDTAQQVTLAADELSKQGYTQQQITDKVYETLFEDSAAWKQVGGPNLNCWSKDDTVAGGSSSITSRHAYEPVRVS